MTGGVTLHLDGARFREHLRTVVADSPGIVPVVKGHGYGYGLVRLAEEATAFGADTIAVGMPAEVAVVRPAFAGNVAILYPYDPRNPLAVELAQDPQVVTTVSRLSDLAALAAGPGRPRVLVEVQTSMLRHGIAVEELAEVAALLDGCAFAGWTIHLPLLPEGRFAQAERLARAALTVAAGPLWLSHLPAEEAVTLSQALDGAPVRLRVGTRLWLGDVGSRQTTATVLDVHPVRKGQPAGYRQKPVPADGWIVVLAGGTSHGVGLEAPTSASTLRQRATALATGSLAATGRALSPFTLDGKKRWFLEPPHMQSSLVFLPAKATPPAVGDEVPVELRLTTATVDTITTN